MRLPFAAYGVREIVLFSLLWIACGAMAVIYLPLWSAIFPLALLVFTLSFFRDPHRSAPPGGEYLVSPADGTIVEVGRVVEDEFLNRECWKIGIFLSVFNVHVNRSPCEGRVKEARYRKGAFANALFARASSVNERNSILFHDEFNGRDIVVRQIAGAIARRIVCACAPGERVERGQRIGMIKFGSRTELYVPIIPGVEDEIRARVGSKVKGGETVVAVLAGIPAGQRVGGK